MSKARKLSFLNKIGLLFKRPIPMAIGLVLTFISTFFIFMILFISTIFMYGEMPMSRYNKIKNEGSEVKGIVTGLETRNGVTINNEHPVYVHYSFFNGVSPTESKVSTMDFDKLNSIAEGDTVTVKYLGNESVIVGIEPMHFPFGIFYAVSLPFLALGLGLLFYCFVRTYSDIHLYRYGIIKEAEIISITPNYGISLPSLTPKVVIGYAYTISTGEKFVSNGSTKDFSVVNLKKTGDILKILVSPKNEKRSCVIPKDLAINNHWNIEF